MLAKKFHGSARRSSRAGQPRCAVRRTAISRRAIACGQLLLAISACSQRPAAAPPAESVLELDAARQYVLARVNAERAAEGLPALVRDPVAERAAQEHAEDMARLGFTAHWGSDGSVPEERYTRAGGVHFVQENAACFFDGSRRALERRARFDVARLDQIEAAFMGERPPHDGHRKNILKTSHTGLGIGLARPVGFDQPCMAQEFVDARGTYSPLPRRAAVGQTIHVAGELAAPLEFGGVGLSRIERAKPLDVKQLNATSSYPVPAPYQSYFPEGFQTPKPVRQVGRKFFIDLPLSDRKRPGRYGVGIWGMYPGAGDELVMVSLRIIDVR